MITGAETILAGILALTSAAGHPIDLRFANAIAEDTASAVDAAHELPLAGAAGPEATGLMLAGLAYNESLFRPEVDDCRVRGALGEITIWQLIPGPNWAGHSMAEICGNRKLGATLALGVLVRARRQTRTVTGLFRAYTSGKAWVDSEQARERDRTYGTVCKTASIRITGVIAAWVPKVPPAWLASYVGDS